MARFVVNGQTPTELVTTPTGLISPFGGAIPDVPTGFLPCDGSVVAQATYPTLFAAIGIAWDTGGEGGGNFRLPDLRGRTCIGQNNSDLPNNNNGSFSTRDQADTSGSENASHSHSGGSLTTSASANHSHAITISPDPGTFLETNLSASYPGNDGLNGRHTHNASSNSTGSHAHAVNAGTSGSSNPTNMSPFAVAAYIIKT